MKRPFGSRRARVVLVAIGSLLIMQCRTAPHAQRVNGEVILPPCDPPCQYFEGSNRSAVAATGLTTGKTCSDGIKVCELRLVTTRLYMCTGREVSCPWSHLATEKAETVEVLQICPNSTCSEGLFLPVLVGSISPPTFPEGTTLPTSIGPPPSPLPFSVGEVFENYQKLVVVDPPFLSIDTYYGRNLVGTLPLVDQDTVYQVTLRATSPKGDRDHTFPLTVTDVP